MKQFAITALLAAGIGYASAQTPPPTAPAPQLSATECGISASKYLDMSFNDFDQAPTGWREIADKPGCLLAAADLIAQYRKKALDNAYGLDWHEAQVRASAGQTEQTQKALELFRRNLAYEKSLPSEHSSEENILKGEAYVAFMAGDLNSLRAAREKLAALPKPDGFEEGISRFKKKYPDLPPPTWPLNLDIVDGLIECFGKPYDKATECRGGKGSSEPSRP